MKETLYFPKLDLVFNLSRIAFAVGSVKIYWYGIILTLGFILGYIYIAVMSKKFGLKMDDIIDVIVMSIVGGIVGARIYYVAFNFNLYKNNLWDVFKIWEGGIAIYGGIIGAFLVAVFLCKRKNIEILRLSDLVVGGLILGQAIGRWGNFVNIEAFGKNTNSIFGMTSVSIQKYLYQVAPDLSKLGLNIDPTGSVHPCFLYESFWCFLGFLLILILSTKFDYWNISNDNKDGKTKESTLSIKKRELYRGELTLIYFAWYGLGRFWIEGLRVDSLMLGNIRISRLVSLILALVSILYLVFGMIITYRDKKDLNKSIFQSE